jgi:integrase
MLYASAFDPVTRQYARISLGHRDREAAKHYADEQAAKIRSGVSEIEQGRPRLSHILGLYTEYTRERRRTDEMRKRDRQRAECWVRFLGAKKDPSRITIAEWERFKAQRATGVIDAYGRQVPDEKRRPVRARTVQADLTWLRGALNWACGWQDRRARPLLRSNPTANRKVFHLPSEKNTRRPIASTDRYDALRRVAGRVRGDRWSDAPCYLPELIDLAYHTGRRITAICRLRYSDLLLDQEPHGAIRWRAEHDKQRRETVTPINRTARAALNRLMADRPGVGEGWIFPNPSDPAEPLPRQRAYDWLKSAERQAELPHLEGGGWHAFRRGWATTRKHLPAPDVAEAGGWKGPHTLQYVYQGADPKTVLRVVLDESELREGVGN